MGIEGNIVISEKTREVLELKHEAKYQFEFHKVFTIFDQEINCFRLSPYESLSSIK